MFSQRPERAGLAEGPYKAKGNKVSAHGNIYHRKILMFMLHKLHSMPHKFSLSIENSEAEKFDDLYLQIKKTQNNVDEIHYVFMQIKHKDELNLTKIKYQDLFRNGNFDLREYFLSFYKIRQRIFDKVEHLEQDKEELNNFDKFAQFFLFTNRGIAFSSPGTLINPDKTSEEIRFVDSSEVCILKTDFEFINGHFQIDFNQTFYSIFEESIKGMKNSRDEKIQEKYSEIFRHVSIPGQSPMIRQGKSLYEMIELFTSKLFFSVQQYSELELDKSLHDNFSEKYKLVETKSVIENYNTKISKLMEKNEKTVETILPNGVVKREDQWFNEQNLKKLFANLESTMKPFWRKKSFYVVVVFFSIVPSYMFYYLWTKTKKEKEQLENEIKKLLKRLNFAKYGCFLAFFAVVSKLKFLS